MEKLTPEEVVLRYSKRGMNILKNYLKEGYCRTAAEKLLKAKRGNVLLTTGFYVAGYAETDGPLGTVAVAEALNQLGFHSVIVTDKYCKGFFELKKLDVEYVDISAEGQVYEDILEKYEPVYMISIERCGENADHEYANMRGVSITSETAAIDHLFELAPQKQIPTIGVGDGGNEIGMGNVKEVISQQLELKPCIVPVDDLIIATTSNWGAYALTAWLQKLSGEEVLFTFEEAKTYLAATLEIGSVDGVLKEKKMGVDGFDMVVEKEILDSLAEAIA